MKLPGERPLDHVEVWGKTLEVVYNNFMVHGMNTHSMHGWKMFI